MFYKIADFPLIAKELAIIAESNRCEASLAICLKNYTEWGRIFASTAWVPTTGDCFYYSNIDTTSLFSLTSLTADNLNADLECYKSVDQFDNSTFALTIFSNDRSIEETIQNMSTPGVLKLCKLFG
jgi:hypothetical protein